LFVLFDSTGFEPKTTYAKDFLYMLYTAAGMVYLFVFFNLLKPYFAKPYNTDEEKELARKFEEKYRKSALDYFKTYPDKFLFLANNKEWFISFKVARHFSINRLTSEGFEMKIYNPPIKEGLLQKLNQVSDDWLSELNQTEVSFTQGVFDKNIHKNQTIITIEDKEEKVYAFLNIVPDYAPGEDTYDLIRKVKDAPNGVLDMLLMKTLLYLKEQGYRYANLGMVPFSGIVGKNLTEKSMRFAYDNIKTFGHYKGLRKYEEKFFPKWEQKYLIYDNSYHLIQIPNALKRVI